MNDGNEKEKVNDVKNCGAWEAQRAATKHRQAGTTHTIPSVLVNDRHCRGRSAAA